MKLIFALLALLLIATLLRSQLYSFRAQKPEDYTGSTPPISLQEHLSGDILSEGVIYGPTGRVTNSFTAKMRGDWDGTTGTLSEVFTYSNGNTQARKWFMTMGENGAFTATADDIVGQATGQVSGSSIMMRYRIVLPQASGGHTLDVTDWLYLTESGVIINRSELRKFGIKVAELVATMRPQR